MSFAKLKASLRNYNQIYYCNIIHRICEIWINKLFLKRPGSGRNVNHWRIASKCLLDSTRNIEFVSFVVQEFDWDDSIQNLILSSFFWGYVVTHIPGGMIAQRWGVHRLYMFAMLICGIATLLIPMAAHFGGWQLVIVCRVICGACQGIVPPVLHTLLSKWAPTEERGRLGNSSFFFLKKPLKLIHNTWKPAQMNKINGPSRGNRYWSLKLTRLRYFSVWRIIVF